MVYHTATETAARRVEREEWTDGLLKSLLMLFNRPLYDQLFPAQDERDVSLPITVDDLSGFDALLDEIDRREAAEPVPERVGDWQ